MTKKAIKIIINDALKKELVRLGVYRKFMRNSNAYYGGSSGVVTISNIYQGFDCSSSPEGFKFWMDIKYKLSC